jgi:hypothetical protein
MKKNIITILMIFQCAVLFAEPVHIGTTYSPLQSEYFGLDWKKTYLAVLEEGFDIIRLGAYWNEIEKEEDIYDFSALDWQIREARKKGVPVILTVGMKAPRWPEYFIPDWILKKARLPFGADISKNEFLRKRTLKFIRRVVNHYKDESIIHYWQVENEPLNRIGEKYWFIGAGFLKQEVELVRSLDEKKRPILLTAATYPNRFLRSIARLSVLHDPIKESLEICDVLGLNVYPIVGHRFWRMDFYFRTTREERDKYFSKILFLIKSKKKEAWIVELQAEPWEPGQLVHKGKERPPTGLPKQTQESFQEFRSLGVSTILLWGAEYWHYRETRHKDTEWREMIRSLIRV